MPVAPVATTNFDSTAELRVRHALTDCTVDILTARDVFKRDELANGEPYVVRDIRECVGHVEHSGAFRLFHQDTLLSLDVR